MGSYDLTEARLSVSGRALVPLHREMRRDVPMGNAL